MAAGEFILGAGLGLLPLIGAGVAIGAWAYGTKVFVNYIIDKRFNK